MPDIATPALVYVVDDDHDLAHSPDPDADPDRLPRRAVCRSGTAAGRVCGRSCRPVSLPM